MSGNLNVGRLYSTSVNPRGSKKEPAMMNYLMKPVWTADGNCWSTPIKFANLPILIAEAIGEKQDIMEIDSGSFQSSYPGSADPQITASTGDVFLFFVTTTPYTLTNAISPLQLAASTDVVLYGGITKVDTDPLQTRPMYFSPPGRTLKVMPDSLYFYAWRGSMNLYSPVASQVNFGTSGTATGGPAISINLFYHMISLNPTEKLNLYINQTQADTLPDFLVSSDVS